MPVTAVVIFGTPTSLSKLSSDAQRQCPRGGYPQGT
jgi:hypothetical protein